MQALQPLRVADVGLATRHMFGVPGVDQHDLEPALLQDLVSRNPVDPGAFHHDRFDPALGEPVRQAVQVLGEGLERPHRPLVAVRTNSGHVHGGADVDGRRSGMDRRQVFPSAGLLRLGHGMGLLHENNAEGLGCGG